MTYEILRRRLYDVAIDIPVVIRVRALDEETAKKQALVTRMLLTSTAEGVVGASSGFPNIDSIRCSEVDEEEKEVEA